MSSSNRVHILPDEVANKIAAGEVVERPASVVKELMENALDAGATHIDVEIVAGGRKGICIRDDGAGMSRDDALLSIERHATSKIRDVHDIDGIHTLGFRGEALAAIASVSRFSLKTRTAEDVGGHELKLSGGKLQDVNEVGCPVGTVISVRDLFFNVPARRKFLRTEQTELSHIRQVFMVYALCNPGVGMQLSVDGRTVYALAGNAALEDRLRDMYGAEYLASLRPVDYQRNKLILSGYVGLPHTSRADRTEQYIFINNRPAGAPLLGAALREAYQALIPKNRHPITFLFLTIDPTLVDVNVHPTKKEVRFRRPSEVRDLFMEGIRSALAQPAEGDGSIVATAGSEPADLPAIPRPSLTIEHFPVTHTFQYPRMPFVEEQVAPGTESGSEPAASSSAEPAETSSSEAAPWTWCRVLGQVGGLYVVLETEDGMVLMDPHAAHERVYFERFMKEAMARDVKTQGLLIPETLECNPKDAHSVQKNIGLLEEMGFGISSFGGDSFVVDAMPLCLGNVAAAPILLDVVKTLEEGGARGGTERWTEEQLAQAACRAAVRARDNLTREEIEQLVKDLAQSEMPYTCPHGRPTLIFMSFQELHRKFGRP